MGVGVACELLVLRRGRESWPFVSKAAKALDDLKGLSTAAAQSAVRTKPATITILRCLKRSLELCIQNKKVSIFQTQSNTE